jgi:hypothetical protein
MVFYETDIFTARIVELIDDESYTALQAVLIADPEAGGLIPKTRGLRKIRWMGIQVMFHAGRGALNGDVRGPAAALVGGEERRAEDRTVGHAPVRAGEPALALAKQGEEFFQILRVDDPVGVLGVLLDALFHAGHAGGEHMADAVFPQQ